VSAHLWNDALCTHRTWCFDQHTFRSEQPLNAADHLAAFDVAKKREELKTPGNTISLLTQYSTSRIPGVADGLAAHLLLSLADKASSKVERSIICTPGLELCVSVLPSLSAKSEIIGADSLFLLLASLPSPEAPRVDLKRLFSSRENGHSFNRLGASPSSMSSRVNVCFVFGALYPSKSELIHKHIVKHIPRAFLPWIASQTHAFGFRV